MKIGELAKRTDCTAETIRYYEREGLLPEPRRSEGNYRQYNESHVEQLVFIRNCRLLDMTHHEIRELLALRCQPQASCGDVNGLIDAHIGHVSERLAALAQLQQQLIELPSTVATAATSTTAASSLSCKPAAAYSHRTPSPTSAAATATDAQTVVAWRSSSTRSCGSRRS